MSKKVKKITTIITLLIIIAIGSYAGYFIGKFLSNKYFAVNVYAGISPNDLRDDISNISITGKTPDDFDSVIAFQLAERVMQSSDNYQAVGSSNIKTSLGVESKSVSLDWRDGDQLYYGYTTYNSMIKESRQCYYTIGGDLHVQSGTPTDETIENVQWEKSTENLSWDEYYEKYGKYPNVDVAFIASTKTVIEDSGIEKHGELYKFTLKLDCKLSTIGYIKQIGMNMGVNPANVSFSLVEFTCYLDQDFKFTKLIRHEIYTVPYGGINLTLDTLYTSTYTIN